MSSVIKKHVVKLSNGRTCKINTETYGSANDVVNDCKSRENTDYRFHDYKNERIDEEWTGCKTYDEALELLKVGYQPTVEKFKETMKIKAAGEGKRIKFQNGIQGFAPVVPLALMGVPKSMIDMTMKPIKCKVIDVYYDMTSHCGVEKEEIIANGQKILGAITELEKQGYRFNLYAIQSYASDDATSCDMLCVKVKSSDRPLDLKRISFPLTHPAFFRVIGFDWYGKFPIGKYRSGYGRGIAYELGEGSLKEVTKQLFGDNAIYMAAAKMYGDVDHLKEVLTNEK